MKGSQHDIACCASPVGPETVSFVVPLQFKCVFSEKCPRSGNSPETPGNSVSLVGLALRKLAEFSWEMNELPYPDQTSVHSQQEADPACLQRTPVFPCSLGRSCILSQACALSPANARPLAFPSLTQGLQEAFKFLPWRLFLTFGYYLSFPLSCTHTCSPCETGAGMEA